jgi:branched-chain amino acid transport system ATP-binding protein
MWASARARRVAAGPSASDGRTVPEDAAVLDVDEVISGYGSSPVLHGLSLEARRGHITVVLGANGVGKTTALRTVAGTVRTWRGTITFDGRAVHALGPEARVRLGIGTVPEAPGIFRNLSVADNLAIGALSTGIRRRQVMARSDELLDTFSVLAKRARQIAGSLSGGEQRMLAIARALMGQPRLLLVDEASMGLAPTMVSEVLGMLKHLRDGGLSVCMVEQDLSALEIADRAYVVAQGQVVQRAETEDLDALRDEAAHLYLGSARGGR